MIKGSNKGTTTDAYGNFSINIKSGEVLAISTIGFGSKDVKILSVTAPLVVALERNTSKLDEVQIVAYGKNTQRFQTGNVASVKAEDIERQPVNNPLLALQGRVAGLFITQNNGLPGSGVKVRIQGQNSIRNGSDPLYVINGVPYNSEIPPGIPLGPLGNSGGMANGFSTGTGNALNYISPSDIESIEVLKDADATAIYGSRAANGAILITTKKGKQGKATLDLNLQNGWGCVTRRLEMLNTSQYLEMRREAFANDGILPQIDNPFGEGYAPDLLLWDTTKNTDWQEKLLGKVARFTNLNASLSGGSSYLQYLVRATYQRETTVLLGNFEDQRGSLSFSITNTSIDRKFNFQLSGSYLADNNKLPTLDITSITIPLAPNSPDLQKSDGTLNWMENGLGASTWGNPLARLYNTYQNKSRNALANMVVSYQILPGLDFRSSLGYNEISSDELQLNPLLAVRPERRAFTPRFAIYGNKNINTWIIEPQLTWKTKIAKGNLEVLLGSTTQQNSTHGQILSGSGHNSDLLLNDINSAPSISSVASLIANYKYAAIFSRINYNWQDKYLVNLSARRDGSSRFGPQNQFNNFGAIGGAWIFSEEKLIKETIRFLSYGKLRGSYGITGSDQIGDYSYLNRYSPVTVEIPYQEVLG